MSVRPHDRNQRVELKERIGGYSGSIFVDNSLKVAEEKPSKSGGFSGKGEQERESTTSMKEAVY